MRRPKGHEPSYPAWSVRWPPSMTHLVFAQFGVQTATGTDAAGETRRIGSLLRLPSGPRHVDVAKHEDSRGYSNTVLVAYWDDPGVYEGWSGRPDVAAWWQDEVGASTLGHWREVATIPTSHVETLHSGENRDNGCSHFLPIEVTPYHDYWGGARDRILASHADELQSPCETLVPAPDRETLGRRIRVEAPENVCLIRTAQEWTRCSPAERATYLETVQPVLEQGAVFIRDHPYETGCISSRHVQELDRAGAQTDKTSVIAYWLSLDHLERWTTSHPTHQAIFATFYDMLKKHDFNIDLALWHEVAVLPQGSLELEYVNCHEGTGFLPFFEQRPAIASAQPAREVAAR